MITLHKPKRPTKIIQFGGGVFLRGFFDWMLQKANDEGIYNGNAVIIRSKTGGRDPLEEQCFNYTHLARDASHNDITLIDSIAGSINAQDSYEEFLALAECADTDVIVSNTTEAGIVYEKCDFPSDACPLSFPAKLTALLLRRFEGGLGGMLIIPCELIEKNADKLKEIVLNHARDWELSEEFCRFVSEECSFRNTLVDRIVSGKPNGELDLGYEDKNANTSEYFHLFVIEGEPDCRLPLDRLGLVRYVPSVDPFRTIKVRILNGAHTSMIPYALLSGVETVRECLENEKISAHLENCLSEIKASLDLDKDEVEEYAEQVKKRFANPYIHHRCESIALNSVSKFKVRVLPSILAYEKKFNKAPSSLLCAFGKLIRLYKENAPSDSEMAIDKLKNGTVLEILSDVSLWGEDLSRFANEVESYANSSK